jgi:hypothetical protein
VCVAKPRGVLAWATGASKDCPKGAAGAPRQTDRGSRRRGHKLGVATWMARTGSKQPNGGTNAARATGSSPHERGDSGSNKAATRRLSLMCTGVSCRKAELPVEHGDAVKTGSQRRWEGRRVGLSYTSPCQRKVRPWPSCA